jgi:hypothetical protein
MTCNVEPKDFLAGLSSLRRAKNLFCLLLVLAVLTQIAAFVMVNWINVIDAAPKVELLGQPEGQEVSEGLGEPGSWYRVLDWVLPFTRVVAVVCGVLVVITMMFAASLSMISGQGGIKCFFSAFFWSLLLLAAVLPWQMVMNGSLIAGAMYNLGELIRWSKFSIEPWAPQGTSTLQQIPYYARFMAYPILVLMIWIVVQVKFGRGFRIVVSNVSRSGEIEDIDTIPAPLSTLPLESEDETDFV